MNNLLEKLAALEHEQWAHWTEHMLDNLTEENTARWRGQIAASYADLTEEEKDKDREWARRVWGVVLEHFRKEGRKEFLAVEKRICDCLGHAECGGDLYRSSGGHFARCHRHIVLQSVWSDVPPLCDLYDWLNGTDEEDLEVMYQTMREAVGLWYWERIS